MDRMQTCREQDKAREGVKWEGGLPSAEKRETPPVTLLTPVCTGTAFALARMHGWIRLVITSVIKGSDLRNESKANEAGSLGQGIELLINLFPSLPCKWH
jgi:hypothetical protein